MAAPPGACNRVTMLAASGLMVPGRAGGQVPDPAAFVAQSAADRVRRLAHELGLSPSAFGPERLRT